MFKMNSKEEVAADLEAELLRLNTLVRKRRAQLQRLEKCPNKDCECRAVWREHIEHALASQVGTIRGHVSKKAAPRAPSAAKAARRK